MSLEASLESRTCLLEMCFSPTSSRLVFFFLLSIEVCPYSLFYVFHLLYVFRIFLISFSLIFFFTWCFFSFINRYCNFFVIIFILLLLLLCYFCAQILCIFTYSCDILLLFDTLSLSLYFHSAKIFRLECIFFHLRSPFVRRHDIQAR